MITPGNHPIKFLLYFEWVLLAIVFLAELPNFPRGESRILLLNLGGIVLFALLGLRLPKTNLNLKILHLGTAFATLVVGAMVAKIRFITLLYVIFFMRISLMLRSTARIFATIMIFVLALFYQFDRIRNAPQMMPRWMRPGLMPPPPRMRNFADTMDERAWVMAISSLILLALIAVFIQLMIDAVLSAQQAKTQLESANAQLRRYALRVEDTATLQERNRIAREIHDSLGHSLTAFNLHLEAAMRLLKSDPAEAQELLVEAKGLGSQALQEVRESVATLRSHPLQGKSLEKAIAQLCEDFTRSTGLVPMATFNLSQPLNTESQTAIYRITQEALTNIAKYAQATAVQLNLRVDSTGIELMIQDDGRGFVLAQNTTGFGLQGMRERVAALNGELEIVTAVGQGCQILVTLPALA
jgi:signal transduction histidine kinase